ncbi:IS4 family transposase, partial [Caldibacillus thermoamylovorans]|nr:IS4 family transposase [Caldibacillus thermoamylovorans]
MISKNFYSSGLKELDSVFSELEINKHLRQAGIKKSFGFSCSYLFQLIFCLIFQ